MIMSAEISHEFSEPAFSIDEDGTFHYGHSHLSADLMELAIHAVNSQLMTPHVVEVSLNGAQMAYQAAREVSDTTSEMLDALAQNVEFYHYMHTVSHHADAS